MKKKTIKKLAKLIHQEVSNYERELRPTAMKYSDEFSSKGDWCDYDSEVSDKFRKMILNLSNYKNNISINIDDYRISVSTGDIKSVKNYSKKNNSSNSYSDEDYVEMSLVKDLGFSISYSFRKSYYKDKNLFNELQPILIQKLREINADNFNQIWTDLMKDSGILRDNNLDEIFNG